MAESVILSAIGRLESCLLRKPDSFEENYIKLRSILVDEADLCSQRAAMANLMEDIKEKLNSLLAEADFEEDDKEKVYNFLVGITDFRECNKEKLIGMEDISEDKEDKMSNVLCKMDYFLNEYKEGVYDYAMAVFSEDNKEKMCSLLAGMAEFWEESNKRKLYSLLVWVAVMPDYGMHKNKLLADKKNVYSLLVEMTELWEDKLDDKEKLHSLLLEITGLRVDKDTRKRYDKELYMKRVYSLMAGIACLCKNVKGKLNMVKVKRWFAEKADLWEQRDLFNFVYELAFSHRHMYVVGDEGEMVEGIKDELRSILDFLRDKKWEEGSRLHYFLSDAVEIAHKAQVLVDVRDSDPFIIFLTFNLEDQDFILEDQIEFGSKIRAIQYMIKETKERMLEFQVERGITNSQNVGGGEGAVVGLEEDVKLLLGIKNIHTTFIRGMAGIGKTTLARILYNHASVADELECRAWVCASLQSSRKEILIELIRQLVDSKEFDRDVGYLERMDNKSLKQMLHQQLQGMRYFIVLDDVWEITFLDYIMSALPKGEGSRLVLTTRSVDIKCDYGTCYDHTMGFLDADKSWKLFLNTIFFDQEIPKQLEKRVRKMLTKCNGLPLAIKEVGRKWAEKREMMSEWEQLVESIDLSETLAALESTYHNLDPLLKSCFLYLSFFKEGTSIRSRKVEEIWFAGGLVSENDYYFSVMLSKLQRVSIVEVTPESGRKAYRINAVFHKLSIQKAEEEEETRLEILRNDGNDRLSGDPRHRVIYCSREKFTCLSTNQNNNHLVSLFFRGGGYFDSSPSHWKHLEKLKILDLEDFGLKILPDAVGKLTELRYLGLRNNYIEELPCSLCQLKNLEVLDIAQNFTMEVPDIIWEMNSLQHLHMCDIICKNPIKMGAMMKNLQTLAYISADNWVCEFSGSEMLSRLRKLGIEELDTNTDMSKLFASLSKLKKLEHLILRGFRYRSMPSLDKLCVLHNLQHLKLEGRLQRLPSANSFPQELTRLSLVNSSLDEDPMPILEDLSQLSYLKLQNAYTGQQMAISTNGFRTIHYLAIEELWNLRKVEVEEGAMPSLCTLDIKSCPNLETLPQEIMMKDAKRGLIMVTTKIIAEKILRLGLPQNWISNIHT